MSCLIPILLHNVRKHSVYSHDSYYTLTQRYTYARIPTPLHHRVCVVETRVLKEIWLYVNQCCFLCRWRTEFVAKEFSERREKKKKDFFCQKNNSRKNCYLKSFEIILVSENFCILLIE